MFDIFILVPLSVLINRGSVRSEIADGLTWIEIPRRRCASASHDRDAAVLASDLADSVGTVLGVQDAKGVIKDGRSNAMTTQFVVRQTA